MAIGVARARGESSSRCLTALLHVECWSQQGNGEMGEMRRILVKLNPANNAMLTEVGRDLRIVDREMLR